MAPPPLVAFTGRARSGKDTAAAFAAAYLHGYVYGLADPIRAMLNAGFGIDMKSSYWETRKELPVAALGGRSPRQLMQWLGTEWGRKMVSEDVWINMAKAELHANGPGMVISDLRFDNEAEWVRRLGGRVIHISRPDVDAVNPHASEDGVAFAPSDLRITNDGTLAELQQKVIEACQ